jgi:hypothetical protein
MNAFEQRDLARIAAMFTDDVVLQDAANGRVSGRPDVLTVYASMFRDATFELTLGRHYHSPDGGAAQEFTLVVTNALGRRVVVEGVDLFEFRDTAIAGIRAYVESREEAP